jgi:hypothetical protein
MYNIFKKEAAMLLGLTERSGSTYRRWEPAPFFLLKIINIRINLQMSMREAKILSCLLNISVLR